MGRRSQVSKPSRRPGERSSTHSRLQSSRPITEQRRHNSLVAPDARGASWLSSLTVLVLLERAGVLDRHQTSSRIFEAALVLQAPTIRVKLITRRLRFNQSKIAAGSATLKPNTSLNCSLATQQEANKRTNSHQAKAGRPCHGMKNTQR